MWGVAARTLLWTSGDIAELKCASITAWISASVFSCTSTLSKKVDSYLIEYKKSTKRVTESKDSYIRRWESGRY